MRNRSVMSRNHCKTVISTKGIQLREREFANGASELLHSRNRQGGMIMEILVPLNNPECLEDYIQAGAREFYFGFYDEEWNSRFGEYSDINRMSGYKKLANANTFEDINNLIENIRKKNADSYITFNSASYSNDELKKLEEYIEAVSTNKPDGIIVSSPELALLVKKYDIPVVISTIAGVYNSDIASFYNGLRVKRIILPRDLRLEEIEDIIAHNRQLEYEIFIMRNGCKFSDSNCLGFHRKEMCSICANLDRATDEIILAKECENFENRSNIEYTDMLLKNDFHNYACGMCAIYDFVKMNVNAGKVVGRSDDCQSVCEDIRLISANIELAKKCSTKEEYLCQMNFPEDRSVMCTNGMSCYYPEVRF